MKQTQMTMLTEDDYSVYSPFDIEKHKTHYVNYLEIIILPDGRIEYAVPSHQEKLIQVACEQYRVTREKLISMCPLGYYGDFTRWLCMITGCAALWTTFCVCDKLTDAQQTSINALVDAGLFKCHFQMPAQHPQITIDFTTTNAQGDIEYDTETAENSAFRIAQ